MAPQNSSSPAAPALLIAGAIGLLLALWLLPLDFLVPPTGAGWRPVGDAAQHIVAQRFFLADAWRWPPLIADNLETPTGANIAFADGIPLWALLLKAAGPPVGFHGIGLWHLLVFVLQPVAAVAALRTAGERRFLPALGVALAAVSVPAFLARHGHAALMGQFTLFVALALSLRAVASPGPRVWAAAAAWSVATLLIHPYLAVMVLALFGAPAATLLLRGDPGWRAALLGAAACAGAVALVMAAFGYFGATGDPGFFGQFAMNLLAPFWPTRSALLPVVGAEVDATGRGGWEGYNWLGAGLLAGLLLLAARPRVVAAALARHAGLALVALALTAFAVSSRVGLGERVLFDLGPMPGFLDQFRASGRFFWPVATILLVATAAGVARLRAGPALVLALGVLQFLDAAPNRAALADWASRRIAWSLDAPALRQAFRGAERLTILPSWPCLAATDATAHAQVQELLLLASERALPVNTMQLSRWRGERACRDAAVLATPPAPGEIRVLLPGVPESAGCEPLGILRLCRSERSAGG